MKLWKITGTDFKAKRTLPMILVLADSADEALSKARILSRWYSGVQRYDERFDGKIEMGV
jgi:hypothetical protein